MSYIGDFALGDTFDTKFTTVSTSGVPTTLAGTPVISAYVGNSVTQITAGITLTVDFDAVTGLHNVRVVASGANGYATASNYQLVITTGTVGGSSVVGYVIAEFSIEARSALRPTVAARTLDVSAAGEAGIDWANIGAPTTTQGLSGTTVGTATALTTNNDKTGYGVSAAAVQAIWDALTSALTTVGSIGKRLADDVDATISSRSTYAGGAVASVTAAVTVGTNNDKTGYGLSAAAVQAIWDALTSALTTVGSIGKRIVDFLTGDAFVRLGAPAGASVSADIAAVQADTDNIQTRIPAALNGGRMASNAEVVGDKTGYSLAAGQLAVKKNVARTNFEFLMTDSTDHITGKTALTVTAQRSIDGAAFAACANAVVEVANGIYKIDLAAADLNGDVVTLKFTATGADARFITILTQA